MPVSSADLQEVVQSLFNAAATTSNKTASNKTASNKTASNATGGGITGRNEWSIRSFVFHNLCCSCIVFALPMLK